MYIVAGLGNPEEEYFETRHNVGRMAVEFARKSFKLPDWSFDQKNCSFISRGEIGKDKVFLVEPDAYMNRSGSCLKKFLTSAKTAEKLVVVYDDLDLPLGKIKISFGKSSGGHRGIESIIKALRTKDFIRIRIGISPSTPTGKTKKPLGEDRVKDFILGKFSKKEKDKLEDSFKSVRKIIENIVLYGREKATSLGA